MTVLAAEAIDHTGNDWQLILRPARYRHRRRADHLAEGAPVSR
jgi:hypothetical protein